jgi:hypothetical protein
MDNELDEDDYEDDYERERRDVYDAESDEDDLENEEKRKEALRNAIAQLEAGAQDLSLRHLGPKRVGDAVVAALATVLATNTTLKELTLANNGIGPVGAQALAAALERNATLTELNLQKNNIGAEGALSLAATLHNNATLTTLYLDGNNIGAEGARSLATALRNNTTLKFLGLGGTNIGAEGARSLAAALHNNAALTSLDLWRNDIGNEGARALAAALDTNRVMQCLVLSGNTKPDIKDLVDDRLHVNYLVDEIASWVASAVARRVELWDDELVLPPTTAARAAVLAFGDELLDLKRGHYTHRWRAGGRDFAAACVLPRAEAALRQELRRLADVSPYLSEHPGGPEIILDQAGKDASEDFEDTGHSPEARATLKKFYVGDAEGPAPGKAGQARSGGAKAESGPSMLTIILVLLVLLGGAYFAFAPAGAADKAEL